MNINEELKAENIQNFIEAQSIRTVSRILAFHVANPSLIPSTPYSFPDL